MSIKGISMGGDYELLLHILKHQQTTPQGARAMAGLTMPESVHDRVRELLDKNREDEISHNEKEELEMILRVQSDLSLIRLKAGVSLKKAKSPKARRAQVTR